MYLRQRFGPFARIVCGKADVKEAYHPVPIDPSRVASFGYVFHDLAGADLLSEFGWRIYPRFWGLVAAAMEHSHNNTSSRGAVVSDIGRNAAEVVKMAPPRGAKVIELPPDCDTIRGEGEGTGDSLFLCVCLDNSTLRSYRLLGERGVNDPPLI